MSVTNQQVISLLENVLFETATQAAANAATWQNTPAASDVSTLAAAMANSGEAKIAATVVGYYISALGRAPTAAEVQFYVKVAEQGLTQSQIAAGQVSGGTWDQISKYFSHSPEFMARGGLDSTIGLDQTGLTLQAVPWLYESVLGRAPNAAEIAYYDNLVINGTDLGTLFRYFTTSSEFHADTDAQIANALASYGASVTDGGHPPVVASGVTVGTPAPPPSTTPVSPPPSFSALTTFNGDVINDAAASGAHTYTAIVGGGSATLTGADHLTGNGLAELDITDGTDARVSLPGTLSGIASIHVNATAGNFGTGNGSFAFNVSGVTGLTSLVATSSSSAFTDFVTAATGVDVTVNSASAGVNVKDAHSLTINDNALTTLTLGGTITNGVTLNDTQTTVSISLSSATVTGGIVTDNHITSLTLSGTGSSLDSISDTALTTLTIGNGADIALGTNSSPLSLGANVATIDLSNDSNANGAYLAINSDSVTITLGTNQNTIDLNSHTGADITVGTDLSGYATNAPNLTLKNVDASTIIHLGSSVASITVDGAGDVATLIADLTTAGGAGTALFASWGGDLYIAETASGTPAANDTTIIKIVGGAALTPALTGGHIHF